MLKHLIDLVGGWQNAKRGFGEGAALVALIALLYLAVCAIVPMN